MKLDMKTKQHLLPIQTILDRAKGYKYEAFVTVAEKVYSRKFSQELGDEDSFGYLISTEAVCCF